MNIFVAIALVAVGIAVGYGFRAWIGRELVDVKDRLARIENKVKTRL